MWLSGRPQTSGVGTAVAPANDTGMGLFDAELGLPLDSASPIDAAFLKLRTDYKACLGTPTLPASCPPAAQTSGFTLAHLQRARREARETLLAFLAGATFLGRRRGQPEAGRRCFRLLHREGHPVRDPHVDPGRVHGATPAVVGPPQEELPEGTAWKPEYLLYRDGPRRPLESRDEPDGEATFGGSMIRAGFGCGTRTATRRTTRSARSRAACSTRTNAQAISRVMTSYAGSNLALQLSAPARRRDRDRDGLRDRTPNSPAGTAAARSCGPLPYDQLDKLSRRYINNPQKRDPHDYVIARAVRFSDIFVPTPGTAADPDDTPVAKTVAGISLGQIAGVWRKVMFVGRGKGGKYLTAIDVTGPGMFTDLALRQHRGPDLPLEPRQPRHHERQGRRHAVEPRRPTTTRLRHDGRDLVGARPRVRRPHHDAADTRPRRRRPPRKPKGSDFVLYVGSGYGKTGEGTSFYSLDPLTGDIITRVDVDAFAAATYPALARSGMPYANALVANPVVFNASRFLYAPGGVPSPNVAAAPARRVYIADLWGRQWKFLTAAPDIAAPGRGPGRRPAVATANSLLGLPAERPGMPSPRLRDLGQRQPGERPFQNFGFRDDGSDTSLDRVALGDAERHPRLPADAVAFVIPFQPQFRGTVSPRRRTATTASNRAGVGRRVFFGGTRFNAPNSHLRASGASVPVPVELRQHHLRARGAAGLAAYNLRVRLDATRSSRTAASPRSRRRRPRRLGAGQGRGSSKVGAADPAPSADGPVAVHAGDQNIMTVAGPGLPQPAVRFGSTVCQ